MLSVRTLIRLAVSLAVLVWSSRVAVDRLVRLAHRFDVPDVPVAVTAVLLGTSLPEWGGISPPSRASWRAGSSTR